MSTYTYTHLEDGLIYKLNMNHKNTYLSSIYTPLLNVITKRHRSNETFKERVHQPLETSYLNYLRLTDQLQTYPSLYSVDFTVSSSQSYFSQLASAYSPKQIKFDNMFPIAVRYTDNKNVWLIERPPFLAHITFRNARSNSSGSEKSYSIWMPWTAMLLISIPESSYYSAQLFFNDSPISSLEERAIPCLFPNMYADGRMCLNQTSTLLQQHLSASNSFEVSTIYNFIINDYMTGGWNTDLGIQVFDRVSRFSPTATKARNTIVNGDSYNRKKYPPALTASGRTSNRKYIPNFLNYFSHSSLEEITSIITEAKLDNSSSYYSDTYEQYINKALQSTSASSNFRYPFIDSVASPPIYSSYDVYIHPSIAEKISQYSFNDEEDVCAAIFSFLKDKLSTETQELKNNSNHTYTSLSSSSLFLDFENESYKAFVLDSTVEDENFFELKFPVNELESSNV